MRINFMVLSQDRFDSMSRETIKSMDLVFVQDTNDPLLYILKKDMWQRLTGRVFMLQDIFQYIDAYDRWQNEQEDK